MPYANDAETAAYTDYAIYAMRPDRFIEGQTVNECTGFRCPRCDVTNRPLIHGTGTACPNCKLKFRLYGNGLLYWEDRGK